MPIKRTRKVPVKFNIKERNEMNLFLDIISVIKKVWGIINSLRGKIKAIAVEIDKVDDVIFTVLDAISPVLPPAWRMAITIIKQFEKDGLDYLLKGVETAENSAVLKKDEKLIMAVSTAMNLPVAEITPVIKEMDKLEVKKKKEKKSEEFIDSILNVTGKINGIVGLINGIVKGF